MSDINITLTPEGMGRLTARIRLRERLAIARQLRDAADAARGLAKFDLATSLDALVTDLSDGGQLLVEANREPRPDIRESPTFSEDALPAVGLRSDEEDIARMTPSYMRGGVRD